MKKIYFYTCDLMYAKDWRASDANQFRLGSSIQKHAGSRGAAPVGGMGSKAPHQKKLKWKKKFKIFQIYMKDGQWAETNEKSISNFSDFYFFILFTVTHLDFQVCHRQKNNRSKVAKFTGKMRNKLKRMKNQFSDF